MKECVCSGCGRTPDQIPVYVEFAKDEKVAPLEYVKQNEGTYNRKTGLFLCDDCYVKQGMPVDYNQFRDR